MKNKIILFLLFAGTVLVACEKSIPTPGQTPTKPIPESIPLPAPKDTILGRAVTLREYPVDIEYWQKAGKTDKIEMQEPDIINYKFWLAERSDYFDHKIYSGEFKHFLNYFHGMNIDAWEGEMRYVLLKGEQIVDQFAPFTIKVNEGYIYSRTLAYISAPPGKYFLQPLYRAKGESKWTKMIPNNKDEEWEVEVLPTPEKNQPCARIVQPEGQKYSYNTVLIADDKFILEYTLYNPHRVRIKGQLKAVWEREFKTEGNTYFPHWYSDNYTDMENFKDEIGVIDIDIPETNGYIGKIRCEFPVRRNVSKPKDGGAGGYCVPMLFLYFRSEKTADWKLVRVDATPMANLGEKEIRYPSNANYCNLAQKHWEY